VSFSIGRTLSLAARIVTLGVSVTLKWNKLAAIVSSLMRAPDAAKNPTRRFKTGTQVKVLLPNPFRELGRKSGYADP
jgi:hypothetical protein